MQSISRRFSGLSSGRGLLAAVAFNIPYGVINSNAVASDKYRLQLRRPLRRAMWHSTTRHGHAMATQNVSRKNRNRRLLESRLKADLMNG